MKINENFLGLEGEGKYQGIPTYFIRTQGCKVNCVWCDSKSALSSNGGLEFDADNLLSILKFKKASRFSLTGGNPMDQSHSEIQELCKGFNGHAHLEHPGIFGEDELWIYNSFDSICFDIKPPSAKVHYDMKLTISNIRKGILTDTELKLIVASIEDLEFYIRLYRNIPNLKSFYATFSPMFDSNNKIIDSSVVNRLVASLTEGCFGNRSRLGIQIHKILGLQ